VIPVTFSAWDVAIVIMLAAIGALYFTGCRRLARRGAPVRWVERVPFWLGWGALLAAIAPPIDALVVQLFSVHMAQHELMMLVGAPLCMAGRPLPRLLIALPRLGRPTGATVLQSPLVKRGWRLLTTPVCAWALHGLTLWVWHLPALYQLAVRQEGVHALQHAMFVGTAMLFWWGVVYGRYGRAGYGAATLFVFMTVVHSGILGAAITFATIALYPHYVAPSQARGIDPLEDQQLAGLIMWIPAGFVLTVLGIGLFAAWLAESDRRARHTLKRIDEAHERSPRLAQE
jgi:putative membrane protein